MGRPQGVLFDLGGTIIRNVSLDYVAGDRKALEFAIDTHGLSAEEVQAAADGLAHEVEETREISMVEFRMQWFYRLLFGLLGIRFTIGYRDLEREFWKAGVTYNLAEGISDVLDFLEAAGIRKGIISNTAFSGLVLEEELEKLGLAARFAFVMASSDYGYRKPHKLIFQVGARKLGLPPEDIWFVGDRLEYDVKGALDSGLFPVWYNPTSEPHNPDYPCLEIKDWYEFIEKIKSA